MINLTNIEQHLIGTSMIESSNSACSVSPQIDFIGNTISWVIQNGQVLNGTFLYGTYTRPISVTINIQAGTWLASNGQSGTITATQQTNLHNQLVNMRNWMENFSINAGLIQGTQTAWT